MGKQRNSSFGEKLRSAEKELTKGLIRWARKRKGIVSSDDATLNKDSEKVVDEAHKVIKKRTKGIMEGLKKARDEFLKESRDEDKR
ncbi:MAG: hypothetical protein J7M06_03680 [Proteobacteria bacterium]|nr:hypothetical protein [Pseudomonadota bacterium]